MRGVLVIIPVVAASLWMACDGGGGGISGEVSEDFEAAAQAAAESAVLTLDDLPPGWTRLPSDEEDETDLELSEQCEILEQDELPEEIASVDSDDFSGPEDQEVSSGVSVFPSEDVAQNALDEFNDALDRCSDELVEKFESLFVEGFVEGGGDPDDIQELNVSLDDLSFPDLGESSRAYRVRLEGVAEDVFFDFAFDIVIVREGRMAGGMFYLAAGGSDIDDEVELANIVADKLSEADASLPD